MDFNIDPDPRSPEAEEARSIAHQLLASRIGGHPSFAFKAKTDKQALYVLDALATIAHVMAIAVTDEENGPVVVEQFKNDPQGLLSFIDKFVDKRIDDAT